MHKPQRHYRYTDQNGRTHRPGGGYAITCMNGEGTAPLRLHWRRLNPGGAASRRYSITRMNGEGE